MAQDFSRGVGSRSTRRVRLVSDSRRPALVDVAGVALPVVAPARTVVDIARRHARIPAIAVGDAALHAGLCTRADLTRELDLAHGMAGIGRARAAVELMNGLSESVLESRSRIEMLDLGLPRPLLQPSLYRGREFLARVDFWWPEYLLAGEADGDLKYENDAQAAFREKTRTDGLHRAGVRVTRWNWRIVNDPPTLKVRVVEMMTPPLAPLGPQVRIEYPPAVG